MTWKIKVISYLENRGILLKGTARKNISQEGGFFNFIWPLMTVRTSLAKSILIHDSINNFKWGNGGCHENNWITWRIGFIKGVSETIKIEAKK